MVKKRLELLCNVCFFLMLFLFNRNIREISWTLAFHDIFFYSDIFILTKMETNNDSLPLISDNNERFRRIRELGSGTYGRVLLALDRDLQQRCALKILPKSTTKYRDFQREYNYSLLLSPHRSIISTYEDRCYQTADAFVIVQEYAPLGDLFESIPPQRGLPEKAVKTVMKQVASALEFMHEKGLVCH